MDKKELKRLYDIEYRKKNKEIISKKRKQYREKLGNQELNRRRNKHIKNIKYNEWKKLGIKWDINIQDPYQMYLDNDKCSLCNNDYKNNSDKQLDHDHLSGHIRGFVCRGCNSKMAKYDNQRIRLCLDLHRFYLLKHPLQ
tara:strand:+ start:45 stop:464 length:420 start_codon:yes stop_codon:yes gene_type:complete